MFEVTARYVWLLWARTATGWEYLGDYPFAGHTCVWVQTAAKLAGWETQLVLARA